MTWIELIAIIITAIVVPYVVQLIKTNTITGKKAQWLAIGISLVAGIVTALISGIPDTPTAWIMCIIAAIGAVQLAYTAFKSVGITSGWLDALGAINYKVEDTPEMAAKNQSMEDKSKDIEGTD